jgi:hypothetical protein
MSLGVKSIERIGHVRELGITMRVEQFVFVLRPRAELAGNIDIMMLNTLEYISFNQYHEINISSSLIPCVAHCEYDD